MVNALWKEGQEGRSKIHACLGLMMSFEGTWAIFGPESKYWRWWWCKSKENRKTKCYLNWSRDISWVKMKWLLLFPYCPITKSLLGMQALVCLMSQLTLLYKSRSQLMQTQTKVNTRNLWLRWDLVISLVNENFSNFGNVKTFVLFCFCFF